ncbi:glycosyltransferase family 2 protein [Sphingomonas oligophenolica]|uniref:Glycosyltransferase family 2 protein n=1 Tax=Sphingomonas oligophenolica TaxID=301154 RepID=A0ABU9YBZ5_9SPHN
MTVIQSEALPLPITVVVPTRNEEKNLDACLARLDAFAHVWVVDSRSTDGTRAIAERHGARWIDFDWSGEFPKKRNWVLINHPPVTPWVLFLDADERVTEAFVAEARRVLADERLSAAAGFWLNYDNHFMGRVLRHGVPQRKLALFRVGAGLYERIEDRRWSNLDMEVHEHPVLNGTAGEIAAPITHLDYRGIDHYVARHDAYASWEAKRHADLLARGDAAWGALTPRQRTKYRNLARWWFAPAYFLGTYVVRLGFLDGAAGFHHAVLKMIYFYQIRLKIVSDARSK